ncbi:1,3-beta glucanase [Cunninghamella echinulata]|nr:1,3-beta glucanase [Cunninghamella echinulata]
MWISKVDHGKSSFNTDPNYKVYRNVKEFGCKGDGVTDDTACINAAIQEGKRCGAKCGSSTLTPAVVYFPSGKYLISSPIVMYYFTQLVGNALNPPTLIASSGFEGMAMIDSNPYIDGGNGDQWYVNQNNFFRQVRNLNLDTTQAPLEKVTTAIHWQVAQATSLTNLKFIMPTDPKTKHQGIWMENGSGGFMSDLTFIGGNYGMWVGNQQFLTRNLSFKNCNTAVLMNWNWQWTFQSISIENCKVGIDMSTPGEKTASNIGSILLLDSSIKNTAVGIKTIDHVPTSQDTSGTLLLDNVRTQGVNNLVATNNGKTLLKGADHIESWGIGSLYRENHKQVLQRDNILSKNVKAPSLLAGNNSGQFFVRSRPQYEDVDASAFVNVLKHGAKGDGSTDDSDAIQKVLDESAGCHIVYFPAGTYILSKTVVVPAGSRITGEAWSVLMAKGQAFQDVNKPTPMIQVGKEGDEGVVEISDMIFSSHGSQPGAVLMEWNLRGDPKQPGSSGIWDAHFRVGGTAGSQLQYSHCPSPVKGNAKKKTYYRIAKQDTKTIGSCEAAHTLLRLTKSSSAYLENVWAWTADHDLDDGEEQRQISIYTGRGILIESQQGPVWLYGVQSEHNTLYQYQLSGAKNVMMSMIQSETPYFQPDPPANVPFSPNKQWNDPTFDHCKNDSSGLCAMAWALRSLDSTDVYIYGAGLYNFFNNYNQDCLKTGKCQQSLVNLGENKNLRLFNLNTKAGIDMIVHNESDVWASSGDNVNTFCQTVNAFLA